MEQLRLMSPDAQVEALRSLPREELARALYDLDARELTGLFSRLGDEVLAELFAELDPTDAAHIIGNMTRAQAAQILEEMEPDEAVDVVGELDEDEAEEILTAMAPTEARDVRDLLEYRPDSAGGLMTRDYVALSPDLTAGQARVILRTMGDEAQRVPYFYVVERGAGVLAGVLSPRNLVLATPQTLLRELLVRDTVKVQVDADQEDAARLIDQSRLRALPVVDEAGRMLGIISAADAAEVLLEEAQEDIERLGGSRPLEEPYLRASVLSLLKSRVPWLFILFAAQAYTGSVLQAYDQLLERQIALTLFIPMLIGIGGNTGSQITTTLVRALATGEVAPRDVLRVLYKEVRVTLLVGLVMGTGTVALAYLLGVGIDIAKVAGLAALCIVLWAALAAAILPLGLRRLRLDPAVISAPFITTLVDGTGLIIYFTLARFLLHLE